MTLHSEHPADSPTKTLHIKPRYFRLCTDPGVEQAEGNFRYASLDWQMPLNEAAVVCVDVWAWHYASDTLQRTDAVTRQKIAPLIRACRRYGLQVIHAPADPVASKHPNWVRLLGGDKPLPAYPNSPLWPPEEFRKKQGRYAQYARPHEPQEDERNRHCYEKRWFHSEVQPEGDEAVVVNGEELHRLCARRGILHLFYVGFHTNACMVLRDYAPYAMTPKGYDCILVRDCTTGMETNETQADLTCTRGQIASFEQFGVYTVTSDELAEALSTARG
jgi:hypothetical protein